MAEKFIPEKKNKIKLHRKIKRSGYKQSARKITQNESKDDSGSQKRTSHRWEEDT